MVRVLSVKLGLLINGRVVPSFSLKVQSDMLAPILELNALDASSHPTFTISKLCRLSDSADFSN